MESIDEPEQKERLREKDELNEREERMPPDSDDDRRRAGPRRAGRRQQDVDAVAVMIAQLAAACLCRQPDER